MCRLCKRAIELGLSIVRRPAAASICAQQGRAGGSTPIRSQRAEGHATLRQLLAGRDQPGGVQVRTSLLNQLAVHALLLHPWWGYCSPQPQAYRAAVDRHPVNAEHTSPCWKGSLRQRTVRRGRLSQLARSSQSLQYGDTFQCRCVTPSHQKH